MVGLGLTLTAGVAFTLAAATPASAAVQFVDEDSVAVPLKAGATQDVEVLNGSARPRKLSLRVLDAPAGAIEPTPGDDPITGPGATRIFTLKVTDVAKGAADGTLLATSSDGTAARLPVRIGPAPKPAPKLPKSLDLGTTRAGHTAMVAVPELPEVKDAESVGRLYSSRGDQALVTLESGRQLQATPDQPGTYTGDVDVNGPAAEGSISLKLNAKDGLFFPVLVLLAGIGLGFVIEWWLTRWRPRSLLDRRLGRLLDGVESRRKRVDGSMQRLFKDSRPAQTAEIPEECAWAVPQVASTDGDQMMRYHLSRAAKELETRLQKARTDPERALFGPDGDAYKALLADADTYAALIGDLREAGHIVHTDFKELRDKGPVALRNRFDYECRSWIIGDDDDLTARRESAKSLKAAAEHFAEYRRRLDLAIDDAPAGSDVAKKLQASRRLLEATFRGDDDQVDWWDAALPKLEASLEGLTSPEAPTTPASAEPRLALNLAPGLLRSNAPSGPLPATQDPEPAPPWDAPKGVFRTGGFLGMEVLIGTINLFVVAVSGLSAVYLANSTFGSAADYVTLALWGSTATAGLALLRRLVPGALTTSQPGVGG
jgi:hypothetical protein